MSNIFLNPHADSGNTSDFTTTFDTPQLLDRDYEMTLQSAQIWYAMKNISVAYDNNTMKYTNGTNGIEHTITFPDGMYGLEDISAYIESTIKANGDDETALVGFPNYNTFRYDVTLAHGYTADFSIGDFHTFIGFDAVVVSGNGLHTGTAQPDVSHGVTNLCIQTDLISSSSYNNGSSSYTVFTFVPDVDPGSLMKITPNQYFFLPMTQHRISKYRIWITDQLNRPVDLSGQPTSFSILLRPVVKDHRSD